MRAADDGTDDLIFEGWSCVTEYGYDMYGGPPYGWTEIVARGAFRKTLTEGADVAFLLNHSGMILARTKASRTAGTMELEEDNTGEHVLARLSPKISIVQDISVAMTRGDMNEMSMAFRVTRQRWEDLDGNEADPMTAPVRRIMEINQHKGDVSLVNYGANDAAGGFLRDLDSALAELRAGRALPPERLDVVRKFVAAAAEDDAPAPAPTGLNRAAARRQLEILQARA